MGTQRKKTALVIMAAGIGSRYGNGIKQLEPVGPKGEIIMDYSIYDALEAGFEKVVFIIRRDLEEEFRKGIGSRIEQVTEVEYAFQELSDLPEGFSCPPNRKKPWGTGQAVLSCREILRDPFAVINADDYYGKEAFAKVHDFLIRENSGEILPICMAGFVLGNTLSDSGAVTRGICRVDGRGRLTGVTETRNIVRHGDGAAVRGEDGTLSLLDADSLVSMNMWGLTPDFLECLEKGFREFLTGLSKEDEKSEYLLPEAVDRLLKEGRVQVEVLRTGDAWFGMTYREDRQAVAKALAELTRRGSYPLGLYEKPL